MFSAWQSAISSTTSWPTRKPAANILGDTSILELPRTSAVVNGLAGDDTGSWTVGYTPQLVAGVHLERSGWRDQWRSIRWAWNGAAPIWRAVMQYAHDRDALPPTDWERPEDVVQMGVCDKSGLLPNAVCPVRNDLVHRRTRPNPDRYLLAKCGNQQPDAPACNRQHPARTARFDAVFHPAARRPPDWWQANNLPLPPTEYDTISLPELFSRCRFCSQRSSPMSAAWSIYAAHSTRPICSFSSLSYGQGPNPSEWFQIGERQTEFRPGSTLGSWNTERLERPV